MSCSIQIKRSAQKELRRIAKPERQRIIETIGQLAENPFAGSILKGSLRGIYRLRVGGYRVLYELGENVLILRVAHRRQAYRPSQKFGEGSKKSGR